MKRLLYATPLLAVPLLLALQKDQKSVKNERPMPPVAVVVPHAESNKPRPPVDDAAPANVETATFALG
jgi:hypothetical protein